MHASLATIRPQGSLRLASGQTMCSLFKRGDVFCLRMSAPLSSHHLSLSEPAQHHLTASLLHSSQPTPTDTSPTPTTDARPPESQDHGRAKANRVPGGRHLVSTSLSARAAQVRSLSERTRSSVEQTNVTTRGVLGSVGGLCGLPAWKRNGGDRTWWRRRGCVCQSMGGRGGGGGAVVATSFPVHHTPPHRPPHAREHTIHMLKERRSSCLAV